MGLWVGSQMAEEADLRREGFPGSVDKGWMPHRMSGSRWLWTFWPVSVARAATAVLLVSKGHSAFAKGGAPHNTALSSRVFL